MLSIQDFIWLRRQHGLLGKVQRGSHSGDTISNAYSVSRTHNGHANTISYCVALDGSVR
jgi:hypothetical protein